MESASRIVLVNVNQLVIEQLVYQSLVNNPRANEYPVLGFQTNHMLTMQLVGTEFVGY
jgi:hypothetical protein